MGILDDAIREHLELKRRRGADSAEVARQEREILGAGGAPADASYDAPAPAAAPDLYETAPAAADYDAGYADAEPAYDDAYAEPAATAEPLAGSPLATPEPEAPAAPEPAATQAVDDLFPGTGELMAAASTPAPAPAPAPAERPATPSLGAPAPAGADQETAARSGARRLSDEELAAWRQRLSERADRLAAGRPGGATEPAAGTNPTSATGATPPAPAARPAAPAPSTGEEPPAYWSGNAGAPATPAGGAAAEPGVPADFFDAGDADTAFAPEPAPEPVEGTDHDVLDDTPDFLSDTPEHDRMWFEQRPPRDFDFG